MASTTGGPNALMGCTAASPSASDPQWPPRMPASLSVEPSGACNRPAPSVSSSGAAEVLSRKNRSTSRARANGCATNPPVTMGPTGCSANSNDVTTPKLPPPPHTPQNRSSFSSRLAASTRPSAVTISTASRLSIASPCLPCSQPMPPPSVRPPTPVLPTTPPVLARPCTCVSRLYPLQVAPPSARATRSFGSTLTWFISDKSIIRPRSTVARPATLWPPPRTATSRRHSRARFTAPTTSVTERASGDEQRDACRSARCARAAHRRSRCRSAAAVGRRTWPSGPSTRPRTAGLKP